MGVEFERPWWRNKIVKKLPDAISGPLENVLRKRMAKKEGWVEVNFAVAYELKGSEIKLHIPSLLKNRTAAEIITLFREGLELLGKRLRSDPNLKSVDCITGYSWLAYKYPLIAQKLHFEVSGRDDARKESLTSINREEFLKWYDSENQTE